jgi:sugar lactone lactonase YvrE
VSARDWRTVATRLAFPEAPRWRDGRLFASEIFGGQVVAIADDGSGADGTGTVTVVCELDDRPSGLGWRPDGTMLVVSMQRRCLLEQRAGGVLGVVAELGDLVAGDCNDMVVDARGNAYIGNFGYDYAGGEERRATVLVMVDARGDARAVADDLWFPNGMVITPDGRTLFVAETRVGRITAFTIQGDGSLTDRRVFAELDSGGPDGMALDAEGALWVASPGSGELLRFTPDGRIDVREPAPGVMAQACALGGPDGRTLYACCSATHDPVEAAQGRSVIMAARVDIPAA